MRWHGVEPLCFNHLAPALSDRHMSMWNAMKRNLASQVIYAMISITSGMLGRAKRRKSLNTLLH
jgi:hypothetical protein